MQSTTFLGLEHQCYMMGSNHHLLLRLEAHTKALTTNIQQIWIVKRFIIGLNYERTSRRFPARFYICRMLVLSFYRFSKF